MITLFYLLRHASHGHFGKVLTGHAPGVTLTEAGRAEAEALAGLLAGAGLSALYTSPRLRARQTAQSIARRSGLECRIAGELDEIDFGRWAGWNFSQLERDPAWRRWNEARDTAATPAGETMRDTAHRLVTLIDSLRQEFAGGRVALVSHSDVIKAGICHYLNVPFQAVHEFEIEPASLTTFAIGEIGGTLRTLNAKAALASMRVPA